MGSEYELHASAEVGELVAVGASAGTLSLARFRTNLSICATRLAGGNACRLGELGGISDSAVQSWIAARARPRLDVLLRMCSSLGVSVAAVLTARRMAGVDWRTAAAQCPSGDQDVKVRRSSDETRAALNAALRSDPPCSVRELTVRLGFQRPERLYQVSGPLCHRITVRHRNSTRTHWWRLPGARRICDLETIRGQLEASLAKNPPIPVSRIARELGYSNGGYIHRKFPELCHDIAEECAAHKLRELESTESAVLAACAEEPPPTLLELSRRLGFRTCSTLRCRLPKLADRLLASRRKHKREKDSHDLRTELLFVIYGKDAPALSSVSRRLNVSRSSFEGSVARAVPGDLWALSPAKNRNESSAAGKPQYERPPNSQAAEPTGAKTNPRANSATTSGGFYKKRL